MNKNNKRILGVISLFLLILTVPMMFVSASTLINPGTTTNFAITAGSTITNTGSTLITGSGGNIGLYPGTSFVNQPGVTTSGTIHLSDAVANVALNNLNTVYNQIVGILPVTRIATQLGGQTLTPGVYDSADGTFQITGTLVLDAQNDANAVFVFKTASSLTTASASNVSLINNAQPCKVFWTIGSSATLGTYSNFVGNMYALVSITATTRATVQGQLLAINGAVTLDTNTITNSDCSFVNAVIDDETEEPVIDDDETETGGETETPVIDNNSNGGELPNTSVSSEQTLLFGILFVIVGISTIIVIRIYVNKKDSIK